MIKWFRGPRPKITSIISKQQQPKGMETRNHLMIVKSIHLFILIIVFFVSSSFRSLLLFSSVSPFHRSFADFSFCSLFPDSHHKTMKQDSFWSSCWLFCFYFFYHAPDPLRHLIICINMDFIWSGYSYHVIQIIFYRMSHWNEKIETEPKEDFCVRELSFFCLTTKRFPFLSQDFSFETKRYQMLHHHQNCHEGMDVRFEERRKISNLWDHMKDDSDGRSSSNRNKEKLKEKGIRNGPSKVFSNLFHPKI